MSKITDYDPDCAEAAAELWAQLANHEGEDADAQIIICRAFKEYACEHDKRITSDEWAQKYRGACEMIGKLHEALTEIENRLKQQADAKTGTYVEEKCLAIARAALA